MNAIRILHLSDLHICDIDVDYIFSVHGVAGFLLGGPALKTDLDRLRRVVEERAASTDWIIITGDITHTGRTADLREAREFVLGIEGDFVRGSGIGMKSLALIPGNHDRYENKGPQPGNVGPFEDKFRGYWDIGQGIQFRILSEDLRIQAGFADFSLQKKDAIHLPFEEWRRRTPNNEEIREWIEMWGNGCVHEELLERLANASARLISEGWKVIWAIHFAPFPPILNDDGWKLRLRNEEKLMTCAKKLDITHIFCGHTHQKAHYFWDDIEIFCAGQSLRDSRFGTAHFFSVELGVVNNKLTTLTWEDVARSAKGISGIQANSPAQVNPSVVSQG